MRFDVEVSGALAQKLGTIVRLVHDGVSRAKTDASRDRPSRCTACGCYSHTKCAGYLNTACISSSTASSSAHTSAHAASPQEDTISIISSAPAMFGNDLTAQVRSEGREVPLVVSKCISAVEAHGTLTGACPSSSHVPGQAKLKFARS